MSTVKNSSELFRSRPTHPQLKTVKKNKLSVDLKKKIICSYKNTTVIKMWVFIPKIHTKISNKSITMQKFDLVAFKIVSYAQLSPATM